MYILKKGISTSPQTFYYKRRPLIGSATIYSILDRMQRCSERLITNWSL